ncbi:uncharacterized protein CBL_05586 [Carabus blaptoides fortunei]
MTFLTTVMFEGSTWERSQFKPINVKNVGTGEHCFVKCLCTIRGVSLTDFTSTMNNVVKVLHRSGTVYEMLTQKMRQAQCKLKDQSTIIIRAWTRQCEHIIAQRVRRSHQMFCLYSRLWEERALRELLRRMQQQMTRRSRDLLLSAMGISAFSWESNRISDEEMVGHLQEFDYVNLLQQKTIVCRTCGQRRLVDVKLPGTKYCTCPKNGADIYTLDEWVPFLERQDLLVWRRQHKNGVSYEYKLYGSYNDVTAEDFLQVQIDTEYRQQWDTTAVSLHVVDTDAQSNSDIIYWEMLWPRLFSNRDYVYNRRYKVDKKHKIITIVSKSIQHPSCPLKPDKHRVNDYQSCMVIRPSSELNRPGIEFTLTYFDDPGVNIPSAITSWVAMAAMPDFLGKLRIAAREYRQQNNNDDDDDSVQTREEQHGCPPIIEGCPLPPVRTTAMPDAEEAAHHTSATPTEQDNSGYWRYMHPYYYLG